MSGGPARVRALIPEIRKYLAELSHTEIPMSLDNWAVMAEVTYTRARAALMNADPELYAAYQKRRRDFHRSVKQEMREAANVEERAAVAEKYSLDEWQAKNYARRSGGRIRHLVDWKAFVAEALEFVPAEGMWLRELEAAFGFTKSRLYDPRIRPWFDPYFDIYPAKPEGKSQPQSYIKPKEKPRAKNRSKHPR
jgi:hypothetical protein